MSEKKSARGTGALAGALAAGLLGAALLGRRQRRRAQAAPARIEALSDCTTVDELGAVRSIQRADLTIATEALDAIWSPAHLERLARTYWRFLTRVTLGLIRVRYGPDSRSVVLLGAPLRLLTFHAPEYELDGTRGIVRWRMARGLLVARRGRGRGYLQMEVRRGDPVDAAHVALHVEVEVWNFYPAIASGLSLRLYNATQSRIHVIVTYGFLRSLTRLDLAESRVGRLSAQPSA
jgi:hypothetical protein